MRHSAYWTRLVSWNSSTSTWSYFCMAYDMAFGFLRSIATRHPIRSSKSSMSASRFVASYRSHTAAKWRGAALLSFAAASWPVMAGSHTLFLILPMALRMRLRASGSTFALALPLSASRSFMMERSMSLVSLSSATKKEAERPRLGSSGRYFRSSVAATEWKVPVCSDDAEAPRPLPCGVELTPGMSEERRSLSSRAALRVKVITSTRCGGTCRSWTRCATRAVIARVFPDPGPAMTTVAAPAGESTASRCSGFSPSRCAAASLSAAAPQAASPRRRAARHDQPRGDEEEGLTTAAGVVVRGGAAVHRGRGCCACQLLLTRQAGGCS
mmetsp:Transcript_721/g.2680  ORF Transcript_721/g.2680 Transcript_721/m.2680 type:complete len:327 (+) Transcript_721:3736-4716(+)